MYSDIKSRNMAGLMWQLKHHYIQYCFAIVQMREWRLKLGANYRKLGYVKDCIGGGEGGGVGG